MKSKSILDRFFWRDCLFHCYFHIIIKYQLINENIINTNGASHGFNGAYNICLLSGYSVSKNENEDFPPSKKFIHGHRLSNRKVVRLL